MVLFLHLFDIPQFFIISRIFKTFVVLWFYRPPFRGGPGIGLSTWVKIFRVISTKPYGSILSTVMETLKSLESSFIGLVSLIWMFLNNLTSRQISLNNVLCWEILNFHIDLKLERGFFDLLFDIFSYFRFSLLSHCFDFDKVSLNMLRQIWCCRIALISLFWFW